MAGISPSSRTLALIREWGWDVDKVERFISFAGKFGQRKDMFGFGDYVAMGDGSIIAIQSCGQAFSEHHRKITEDEKVSPMALKWIQCGGRLILIGWRKTKLKRGGKAMRWNPRIKEYKQTDFIKERE